jgi:hypothetical protein
MFKSYSEFLFLARDVIKDAINDYIDYQKAQIILWKYGKKDNFCTACGIVNQHELEALLTVSEHEQILRNKKEMKTRLKNSKKTA